MYVIHEPSQQSFDKVGVKGKIFPTQDFIGDVEVVRIDTESGHKTTIIEHTSTFVYYVIEGTGHFEIDGVKESCAAGDLVVIPPGHAFIYKGKLKLLLIVTPPWKEEQEETVG